jgi:hypothetical protein
MSLEKFGHRKSNVVEQPRHHEDIEDQIESEVGRLKVNSETLKNDLSRKGSLDFQKGDESIQRLSSSANKLIIGAAALIAIPVVASLVSPEVMGYIGQFNEMAKEFTMDHLGEVLAAVLALTAIATGPGIIQGIRDERQQKREDDAARVKEV